MVFDENKVSHMDDNVNSMIADKIDFFGKVSRTTVKKHTFVGLDIEFIGGNKVKVSTPHHVDKAQGYFAETLKGNVVHRATSKFFNITNEAKDIDDEKKERYHLITAKIL